MRSNTFSLIFHSSLIEHILIELVFIEAQEIGRSLIIKDLLGVSRIWGAFPDLKCSETTI